MPCSFQIPDGHEDKFTGIVDLLTMEYVTFEGDNGEKVMKTKDIPAHLRLTRPNTMPSLIEKIVEHDDSPMAMYLEGKEPDFGNARVMARKATIAGKIYPVITGSALKNKGVQLMLDAVAYYLPAPTDVPPSKASTRRPVRKSRCHPMRREPFRALAFKTATDPYVGSLDLLPRLFGQTRGWLICFEYTLWPAGAHRPHRAYACQRPRGNKGDFCGQHRRDRRYERH